MNPINDDNTPIKSTPIVVNTSPIPSVIATLTLFLDIK